MIQKLQEENQHLRQQKLQKEDAIKAERQTKTELETCKSASCMLRRASSSVCGSMAYFRPSNSNLVLPYNSETKEWSTLPECPTQRFTLAVVNGLITAVGRSHHLIIPVHSSCSLMEVGWSTSHPCQLNVNSLPLCAVERPWWWQKGREKSALN